MQDNLVPEGERGEIFLSFSNPLAVSKGWLCRGIKLELFLISSEVIWLSRGV